MKVLHRVAQQLVAVKKAAEHGNLGAAIIPCEEDLTYCRCGRRLLSIPLLYLSPRVAVVMLLTRQSHQPGVSRRRASLERAHHGKEDSRA